MSVEIEILRKAISRKHPCDECHTALSTLEELIRDDKGLECPQCGYKSEINLIKNNKGE